MRRSKADFQMMRFKQSLLAWDREFSIGLTKDEAEPFLAAAQDIIKRRITAEEDPF